MNYFLLLGPLVTIFFLGQLGAYAQSTSQSTQGDCSPAVVDVSGNVTITCNINGQKISIPVLKGYLPSGNDGKSTHLGRSSSHTDKLSIQYVYDFLQGNENSVVYFDIAFDREALELYLEKFGNSCINKVGSSGLCLNFKGSQADVWSGLDFYFNDYWGKMRCGGGIDCIPCESGFCNVKGFFAVDDIRDTKGYVVGQLSRLRVQDIALNPKYQIPNHSD